MRARDFLNEVNIDNKGGWGAVPFNMDVDYFGLRVHMKPSTFLKLAAPLEGEHNPDIEKHIAGGGAIGAPFLDVVIPAGWEEGDYSERFAKIRGHEGRNRMKSILAVEGDDPVEVHLIPGGGMRARHLTPEIVQHMNAGMMAERSTNIVAGPLFAVGVNESILTERGTDVLFHATNIFAALKILSSDKFELSSAVGSVEQQYAVKGYPYFMSATRSLTGDYHSKARYSNSGVMFDLDGRWLGQRYPVRPIDYWEQGWVGNPGRGRESEDRIYSKKPYIPLAAVTSVHVYIQQSDKDDSPTVRKILLAAKSRGIPIYLYRTVNDWMTQNTARVVKPEEYKTLLKGTEQNRSYNRKKRDYVKPWLELLTATRRQQLSPEAEKLRRQLVYYGASYPDDISGIATDVGNSRKPNENRTSLFKLIDYLRKHKMDLAQFRLAMIKKWQDIE